MATTSGGRGAAAAARSLSLSQPQQEKSRLGAKRLTQNASRKDENNNNGYNSNKQHLRVDNLNRHDFTLTKLKRFPISDLGFRELNFAKTQMMPN